MSLVRAHTTITVNLKGFTSNGVAQDWQLAAINPNDQTNAAIKQLSNIHFHGNSFTVTVPMESVSMFVIEPVTKSAPLQTPSSVVVTAGQTANFFVGIASDPASSIQWQVSVNEGASFTNIPGATSTTYSFKASFSQNRDEYRAIFTNIAGSAATGAATLTVEPPRIASMNGSTAVINESNTLNLGATLSGAPLTNVITTANAGSSSSVTQTVGAATGNGASKGLTADPTTTSIGSSTLTNPGSALGKLSGAKLLIENDTTTSKQVAANGAAKVASPKIIVNVGKTRV